MRLLHCSDIHGGVVRYGVGDSRLRDIEATLGRIADDAVASAVTWTIISGDAFDSRRPGPDWLRVFADFVHRIGRLIIVPGNHDGTTTIGDPSTHALLWLASLGLPGVHVLTSPGVHRLGEGENAIDIFALPYPHKRALDAQLAAMPVDERANEVGQRVERIIAELAIRPSPDVPFVLVGHVTVLGAKLGSEAAMKLGWDAGIGVDALQPFDYAALGHVHRQQQIAPNAWYAGSVEYLDFKDLGAKKGWLIVDVTPGQPPVVTPRLNPGRPMLDVSIAQHSNGDLVASVPPGPAWRYGPIVRLSINATVDRPRPQAIAALVKAVKEMGASFVKTAVRLDLPTTAATATEVDPEADTDTLLAGWLVQHGHPIEPTLSVGRQLLASLDA